MTDTIIDLMRHGEPVGGRRYRGHTIDDPLTDKGWSQMHGAIGDAHPWDLIISSPLQRCQAFAKELHHRHGIPLQIEEQFKEVGFGHWEGLSHNQVKQDRAEEYQAFYQDPVHSRPQGAENLDAFIQRVTQAYDHHIENNPHKHLLIISHAGVTRAILAHTVHAAPLGLYRIKVTNGGISRIRFGDQGSMLEMLNGQLN